MSSHVAANNELLTLWLKASGGLPADEARELIEQLAEARADLPVLEDEIEDAEETAYAKGRAEALAGNEAYETGKGDGHAEGRARGYADALRDVQRIINGPGWGRKPTLANIIADINQLTAKQHA